MMIKRSRNLLIMACLCIGGWPHDTGATVSTNVPLSHWSYEGLDRLAGQSLLDSHLAMTRPYSRIYTAQLILEALDNSNRVTLPSATKALLERLEAEFDFEITALRDDHGPAPATHIKPVEDPYVRYIYGKHFFDKENEAGDPFQVPSNVRLGFRTRGVLGNHFAYDLHPEYRDSTAVNSELKLIEGYGKIGIGFLDIQLGQDSLWWGPGQHGSMLMSNNAAPLPMLKIGNDIPILLPWIFRYLGPFQAIYFVSELEKERHQPKANLTGLRFNMKPHPDVELGFSRTIMFGGDNFDVGLWDYLQIFWPKNVQGNENQMSAINLAWRIPMPTNLPINSLQLYGEYAGEDSAGFSKYVPLLGLRFSDLFRQGTTDLSFEYAKTLINGFPNTFYQHTIFQSGHTYKRRMLGHHIGTDSTDYFLRLTHYLHPDIKLGLDWNQERSDVDTQPQPQRTQYGLDLEWFALRNWELRARYQYEDIKNDPTRPRGNHIVDIGLTYNF